MIKIIEVPQRADQIISHEIKGEILKVTIDEKSEIFDFTNLPEGEAGEIKIDILPVNPILSARKNEGILTVELLRFYSFEEKEVYENGED